MRTDAICFLGLLAVGLFWSGCDEPPGETLTAPLDSVTGDLSLETCVYEARDIEYAARCGDLVVPENRSDPDSRLISVPIIRVLATENEALEPIYYLAGGPGGSNTGFSRLEGLIDQHDIVLVGYRGVDGSTALDCPEVNAVLGDLPADLLTESATEAIAATFATCAARLDSEGIDTDGYTVLEVVDDVEAARAALGDGSINLLSQSYGTRLAMIYAWRYPGSLYRSAMVSVNPPGHFVWFPEIIDEQIRHYSNLCRDNPECSRRTDDLAATIYRVSQDMPDSWLFFPIKRGNVLAATFMLLYHTTTAPKVFDSWLSADEGDPSGLAVLSLMIDLMLPRIRFLGDSAAKATSADYHLEPGYDYMESSMPANSIIGAGASLLGWAAALGWPVHPIPEEYRQVQPSDIDTLLISGSIDFSTPAQTATEELLPHLTRGRQVILSEFGHTADVWSLQPEATIHLLTSFYDTGLADDSMFEPNAVEFEIGLGFPAMMKLGLAVVGLVGTVAVGLVVLLARRFRRRLA